MAEYQSDRLEFRIFAHDLTHLRDALKMAASRIDEPDEHLVDDYVLCRGVHGVNLKVRKNRLSLKVLRAKEGALERWHPVSEQPFPMDARAVKHIVRTCLGVSLDLPDTSPLDAKAFVKIVGVTPSLSAVRVSKHRSHFDYADGIKGECADLDVKGLGGIATLAVEGAEPAALEEFIERNGLSAFGNENYPSYLQKVLFG